MYNAEKIFTRVPICRKKLIILGDYAIITIWLAFAAEIHDFEKDAL